MAKLYDNINSKFTDGLKGYLSSHGVTRADFCVGYFNLRGWNMIFNEIENLAGAYVDENGDHKLRTCRLLVGMQQAKEELVKMLYSSDDPLPDSDFVRKQKVKMAIAFRKQLQIGIPTAKDEFVLRQLSTSLAKDKDLIAAGHSLFDDYENKKFRKDSFYKSTGRNATYYEYYPKKSKVIIDKIDSIIANLFSLSEEELDLIINYDIKYHMGDELN